MVCCNSWLRYMQDSRSLSGNFGSQQQQRAMGRIIAVYIVWWLDAPADISQPESADKVQHQLLKLLILHHAENCDALHRTHSFEMQFCTAMLQTFCCQALQSSVADVYIVCLMQRI